MGFETGPESHGCEWLIVDRHGRPEAVLHRRVASMVGHARRISTADDCGLWSAECLSRSSCVCTANGEVVQCL